MRLSPSEETRGVDSTSIPYRVLASLRIGAGSLPSDADDRTMVPCKSRIAQACCPGMGDVSGSKEAGCPTGAGGWMDAMLVVYVCVG